MRVLRRGRKSTDRHCGKVIEAQPPLGQISPSEAAWVPRGQTARRLNDHLAASDKGTTMFGVESSTLSYQRRQNGGRDADKVPLHCRADHLPRL
jgi:hypothetical protein